MATNSSRPTPFLPRSAPSSPRRTPARSHPRRNAYCWGYDVEQAGVDQSVLNPTPVVAPAGVVFQSLSVSKVDDVTCALATTGAAYCWGDNDHGQLGDGTTTPHSSPAPVAGGLTFKSIAVGDAHVCGVTTNGSAYCWGFSANGAFGDNSVGEHLTPTPGAPGLAFQSVVAGSDFTCGLTTTGTAYCWGLGNTGQLGDDAGHSSRIPVVVSGGLTFQSIVAGGLGACGLTTAGKAYCWGNDFFGTVGDGSSATEDGVIRRVAPTAVAGDLTFASLAAGYQTMCGLTASGAGYCWGSNDGAIGDGTLDRHSTPGRRCGWTHVPQHLERHGLQLRRRDARTRSTAGATTATARSATVRSSRTRRRRPSAGRSITRCELSESFPFPIGGGPKPTFDTYRSPSGPKVIAVGRNSSSAIVVIFPTGRFGEFGPTGLGTWSGTWGHCPTVELLPPTPPSATYR